MGARTTMACEKARRRQGEPSWRTAGQPTPPAGPRSACSALLTSCLATCVLSSVSSTGLSGYELELGSCRACFIWLMLVLSERSLVVSRVDARSSVDGPFCVPSGASLRGAMDVR